MNVDETKTVVSKANAYTKGHFLESDVCQITHKGHQLGPPKHQFCVTDQWEGIAT